MTPTLPSSPPRSTALADSARAMLTTMAERESRAHPTPHDDDDDEAAPTPGPAATKAAAVTLSLVPMSAGSVDVKISFRAHK